MNRLTGHSPGFFSVYTLPPNQAVSPEGQLRINQRLEQSPPYRNVRELTLVEMTDAEVCCGFGGTFAAKFPMISTAMGEVKCRSALDTGADYIVSNDSSCLMQVQGVLDRQGAKMKTIHLAEVLARS